MTQIINIERKELTADEILNEIESGNRLVIEINLLRVPIRMVLRKHDETYYCDTIVTLFTFDNAEDMRDCLERYRLAKPAPETERSTPQKQVADD